MRKGNIEGYHLGFNIYREKYKRHEFSEKELVDVQLV